MSAMTDVRPFRVDIPEDKLTELRRRIDATRWPTGYARADSPSTGCWSRTCARSPQSARSGGPRADEHGPQHRVAFPCEERSRP